jgi:drug/metabolite transporter (DMT)-like permease
MAAIFIRLADTEPMTVATYRMLIGAAIVSVPALVRSRREVFGLRSAEVLLLAGSAACLAAHFATWTWSLSLTTVASSVLLVTTTPIFVAIASHFFLRDRLNRLTIAAIVVSLVGGAILSFGDWDGDGRRLLGDALALAGAIAVSGYMLVGRRMRAGMGNLSYISVVYSMAGVALLIGAVASGAPMLGLPWETYFWIGMAALFPQAIGHSLLNWSLAHTSATNVSLAVRAEPVVSTLVAIPVLGEVPSWTVVPGGALLLMGVYLAIRSDVARGLRAAQGV